MSIIKHSITIQTSITPKLFRNSCKYPGSASAC